MTPAQLVERLKALGVHVGWFPERAPGGFLLVWSSNDGGELGVEGVSRLLADADASKDATNRTIAAQIRAKLGIA